jgi:two-component system, cell cycle sensor histidine kinase and response regulator CckA
MDALSKHLRTILDSMPVGCMLQDGNLQYIYWNRAAQNLFEYSSDEVTGKHPSQLIALPADSSGGDLFRRFLTGGDASASCVCENRTKEGRIVSCEWSSVPFYDGRGVFTGLLSICQDLSGRKRYEEQLQQSQKLASVGLLVGGIAHDFNNLLTIIGGYSRMLMRDSDPQTRGYHAAEQVAEASDRAAALTSQLLVFSRKQNVQLSVLDPNIVIEKMQKMLRRILGEDVEMVTALEAGAAGIKADRGQVEQVLMNLAVNARWAMPVGGRLRIETRKMTFDGTNPAGECPPGDYVVLSVSDTGVGMDRETKEQIFEPFFTTRKGSEGTGLGLATVYKIVKDSDAHISVESEIGRGTTFRIYFPQIAPAGRSPAASSEDAEERVTSGTILLVEDEAPVLETVKHMLVRQGFTVLEASGPGAALAICRTHRQRIDILLTDVVLRGGNGPDLARELTALKPEMQVIYMSGYPDHFLLRKADKAGAVFLQKPFSTRMLQAAIRTAKGEALATAASR